MYLHLNALCLVEKQQISILEFLNWLDHSTNSRSTSLEMITLTITGADLGFQVRGGALNKIAPSGGRRKNLWGISCEKSRFYAKKSYFFPILGGAPPPPPWIRPCITPLKWYIKHRQDIQNLGKYSFSIYRIACFIYFFWMENIKKKTPIQL